METTIPSPKDIVIVLDRSDSMEIQNIMDLAKDAASTVVQTLNPNDRVSQPLVVKYTCVNRLCCTSITIIKSIINFNCDSKSQN